MSKEITTENIFNPTTVQQRIAEYHQSMSGHMNMHQFHAGWHQINRDPNPPSFRDPNWGTNILFGRNFLQMHHEMVNAADNEPKEFMRHQSIMSWFRSKGYAIPAVWNPLTPIPNELAFIPTDGGPGRVTNNPQFQLPSYFTVRGGADVEPITGARRLSDFRNVNQLGCCIVFPHNMWHARIGGAMNSFFRAIDDPVFYFGVHRHIDDVYMTYLRLIQNRAENFTTELMEDHKEKEPISAKERKSLKTWEELGISLE